MPSSTMLGVSAAFVCDCEGWMRSACADEAFYKEHGGKKYCVLHFPGGGKSAEFGEAVRRKLGKKDFNFRGVWFPDEVVLLKIAFDAPADFMEATFDAGADFDSAVFGSAAYFSNATFRREAKFGRAVFGEAALFNGAAFRGATTFAAASFSGGIASFAGTTFEEPALFTKATFSGEAHFGGASFNAATSFDKTLFSEEAKFTRCSFNKLVEFEDASFIKAADFYNATFLKDVSFRGTNFYAAANFNGATFGDYLRIASAEQRPVFSRSSSFSLQFARIEKPEQVSFHTMTLRPHWFVNVDARRFEFANVDWDWRGVNEEVESLPDTRVASRRRLLAIACRNLAVNAEENHRYEEASRFRYMAMEARRLERWRGFAFWTLEWWYWLASGYGERVWRAFGVLLAVWLLFGALYARTGFARREPRASNRQEAAEMRRDESGEALHWPRALTYSLGVMTLQKPEPRPATDAAQAVVMLETILGPVQAALLALAIRRKFMR